MFLKTFRADLRFTLRRAFPCYIVAAVLLLTARLILSLSRAVAVGGKPPFWPTAASYVAYFGVLLCCAAVFLLLVVLLKRTFVNGSGFDGLWLPILSKLLVAGLFALAAYGLFLGGYFLLAAGDSYFAYFFSGLLPPLAYSAATYGAPFVLWSVLSVAAVLLSLLSVFAACFAFAARFRRHNIPAIAAFGVLYAVVLIIFLFEILCDFPVTEWFAGYMISGNYAPMISGSLALALAFLPVGIASYFLTVLSVRRVAAPPAEKKKRFGLSKKHL